MISLSIFSASLGGSVYALRKTLTAALGTFCPVDQRILAAAVSNFPEKTVSLRG